jgi:release factor glutamine methyltransferase
MGNYQQAFYELKESLQRLYDEREAAAITHEVLEHVTGMDRLQRLVHRDAQLTAEQVQALQRCKAVLISGEPLQYVLGYAWFLGRRFGVNNEVLIPRPETEELVQWIVSDRQQEAGRLLDIGTGSGCIAISVKLALPVAEIAACDVSEGALATARSNAETLGADIHFFQTDILDEKKRAALPVYDVLVSNPPYIPFSEKENLHQNVRDFEPGLALFAPDEDPLLFYRAIAHAGRRHLAAHGAVYCELHRDHADATAALFTAEGYQEVVLRKDMHGNPRMLRAIRP